MKCLQCAAGLQYFTASSILQWMRQTDTNRQFILLGRTLDYGNGPIDLSFWVFCMLQCIVVLWKIIREYCSIPPNPKKNNPCICCIKHVKHLSRRADVYTCQEKTLNFKRNRQHVLISFVKSFPCQACEEHLTQRVESNTKICDVWLISFEAEIILNNNIDSKTASQSFWWNIYYTFLQWNKQYSKLPLKLFETQRYFV